MQLLLLAEVMDKVEEGFWPGMLQALTLAACAIPICAAVGRHAPRVFVLVVAWLALVLGGCCVGMALADDVARYAEMEAGTRGLLMWLGPQLTCAGSPFVGLLAGLGLRWLVRRRARNGDAPRDRAKL